MRKLLTLTLFLLATFANAENEIKVRANHEFLLDTGKESGRLCFGKTDCSTWSTFYLFNAKVEKVILGVEPNSSFKVIYGQHALLKQNLNSVVVTLKKLKVDNEFNAKYQVIRVEFGSNEER